MRPTIPQSRITLDAFFLELQTEIGVDDQNQTIKPSGETFQLRSQMHS
jgi:hypothetical protein